MTQIVRASTAPSALLQIASILLPALKCALCPVCLGLFGGALASVRFGVAADERFAGTVILAGIAVDFLILGAAARHHHGMGPLAVCALGASLALLGHFALEPLEPVGLALLMLAAVYNVVLLRRHRCASVGCCD